MTLRSTNRLTFSSSLERVETACDEFPLDDLVSAKRWRFNRIGLVSLVDVISLDERTSKRLLVDEGNEASLAKMMKIFFLIEPWVNVTYVML